EAEPAQRVAIEPALLVQFAAVAVAARVLLINRKLQSGPAGKTDNRLGAFEDRAMLRVPTNRNRRRGPAAFFRVAINRVGDAETGASISASARRNLTWFVTVGLCSAEASQVNSLSRKLPLATRPGPP